MSEHSFHHSTAPLLSVVIPMFNESEGIAPLLARLIPVLDQVGGWEIICINDGSTDDTLERLKQVNRHDARIKIVNLSRNFGKDIALSAGLDHAAGRVIVPLDSDLQDPPELIPDMLEKWKEGYKVVLATRRSRPGDSWLKRRLAGLFYRGMNTVSSVKIPANTGDFRLMDRQVVEAVKRMPERIRFMKGLFAWVGFSTTTLYYDRPARLAGSSRWSFWKLWKFALDGIFAFTTLPLQIWIYLGALISFLSFFYALALVTRALFFSVDIPGYTSLMVMILFLGGIQLISLGIIGEYVGRIYRESKRRPLYIIQDTIGIDSGSKPD